MASHVELRQRVGFLLGCLGALLAGADSRSVIQVRASGDCVFVVTGEREGVHALCDSVGRWRPLRGLPDTHLTGVAGSPAGPLVLGTGTGVLAAAGPEGPWQTAAAAPTTLLAPGSADGRHWWLGVPGRGLHRLTWRDGGGALAPVAGLPSGLVSALADLPAGGVAVGIWGQGVFAVDGAGQARALGAVVERSPITALAATAEGGVVAGALAGGLYRRGAGDGQWHPVDSPDLRHADVAALAVAPSAVLAGTWGRGVWRADGEGRGFEPTAALPEPRVGSVAIDARGHWWAGTPAGLYRSVDQGGSWQPVAFERPDDTFEVVASREHGLFATVRGRGLLRSRDGGRSWQPVSRLGDATAIAADARGRLLAAGPARGVRASADGGESWVDLARGLPAGGLEMLRSGPDGTAYAIPSAGPEGRAERMRLYRLGDDDRWMEVEVFSDDEWVRDYLGVWGLVFLPSGEGVAHGLPQLLRQERAGGRWRIEHFGQLASAADPPGFDLEGHLWTDRQMNAFRQAAPGAEWEEAELPAELLRDLLPFGDGSRALAVRRGGGVARLARSEGGGWRIVGRALEDRPVAALAWDGRRLYAATAEGLLASEDGGARWQERPYGLD